MTGRPPLRDRLDEARALTEAGDFAAARAVLEAIAAHPDRAALGPETMLGLPRKLHAAFLRLSKRQGDTVGRVGWQATLAPRPEVMEALLSLSAGERQAAAAADRLPVPRAIHQIWIGPRPVPPTCGAWQGYAAAHGYAYRLWREPDLDGLVSSCGHVFSEMLGRSDFPGAVDVARYAILSREGGVYLDCDWYPGRRDVAFHDRLPMIGLTAMAEPVPRITAAGTMLLANSFIAAPPAHPVFARLMAALPGLSAVLPGAPAWWATGPLPFTLAARAGALSLADAGLVAGAAADGAAEADVAAMAAANEGRDGGLLIAWKPWGGGT